MANMLERNKNVKAPRKTRAEYAEDALYREVWEEVNNEKTVAFVKKYSRTLVAGAIILMICVTGIQIGVRSHAQNKLATAVNYETAVLNADSNALAALAENAGGATGDLAMFQSYLLDNDITKLERLANNGETRDFRDLAKIHIVNANGDNMTGAELEQYFETMNTKKSPFYYTSRLTIAQKYLSEGNRDSANKWLDLIINDKDTPVVISGNAQMLR